MAVVVATADMTIQKNSSILVNVEEALADLIVVSYSTENKKFEGILLDTKKSKLPYGVYNLHPAFSRLETNSGVSDDKLYSVSQRFTYQEPQFGNPNAKSLVKGGSKKKVPQKQKMTVRLRPRKVLCSNCKGICNENNENVDVSRKRKHGSEVDLSPENKTIDNGDYSVEKNYPMRSTLIPKLSRLQPQEISNAMKSSSKGKTVSKSSVDKASDINSVNTSEQGSDGDRVTQELTFVDVAESFEKSDCDVKTDRIDCLKDRVDSTFSTVFSNARTLKICFGAGEGTVVKIPAVVGDFNEDSGVSCDMAKPAKQSETKAAKKALKRAKRLAKKDNETKETFIQSPKHAGALSPKNNVQVNCADIDVFQKKHKHKMKHKKKNKEQKCEDMDENTSKATDSESINYFSDIKKHCLKGKLSISIQRPSNNSYERHSVQEVIESSSDGWESDVVPEFPEASTERLGNKPLIVSPGDIVWGKVRGFPWWPGKVISVTSSLHAHVAWYASTTSSLMPCDSLSPFLDDYKIHFNKKKRGPYKDAVNQANLEANKITTFGQDPLASPTNSNMPALSPRAIDLFS